MSYASVIVNLALGQENKAVLRVAADIADQFDARVIGIAAGRPIENLYADGYVATDLIEQDRITLAQEIGEAEAAFRAALDRRSGRLDWRSTVTIGTLSDFLVRQARSADLLITALQPPGTFFNPSRGADIADLVMRAGRPVLLVPTAAERFSLERVVVGWKDTRETRRAITDALPLLRHAAHVTVLEIAQPDAMANAGAHLDDVKTWLTLHGIIAETRAVPAAGQDAEQFEIVAQDEQADLIVAGAYGHSRLSEWALGGMTRDYLLRAERFTLVSH